MEHSANDVANPFSDSNPTTPNINVAIQSSPTLVVPIPTAVLFAKPFPNILKIEVFEGQNFQRWQELISSVLDMHGVVVALTYCKPSSVANPKEVEAWAYVNKVCRHIIISTLSNDLFVVYGTYKEVNQIWESMITKYIAEDAGKQKFVIGNFHQWEMVDDKDIKL